jgi:predicted transposase YbfD/YdcC
MKLKPKHSIADYFGGIEDPRIDRRKQHKLIDIITIAICAVVCGAETWVDMEVYGKAKFSWLNEFLELRNGIPSHDTFARVFAVIKPEEFQQCFMSWVQGVRRKTEQEIIAFDGKQSRNSGDKNNGKRAINMVSALAIENRLVLGQRKVEGKSNEITALPELIEILDLAGCIVTIDAMGCQTKIVEKIVEKEADYVIALKKNQGNLCDEVRQIFKEAIAGKFEGFKASSHSTREFNKGREEIRNYLIISDVKALINSSEKWVNLESIGLVESVRIVNGKTSVETRYFITSLDNNVELFAKSVRGHWGIENSLHWILDVAMREDKSRIRKDNAPANFAMLRHIAVNVLRQNKSKKFGVRSKQFLAAIDESYMNEILEMMF